MNITGDRLIDLIHAEKPSRRGTGRFLVTDAALLAIRRLRDGDGQYLWRHNGAREPQTVLGYPVEVVLPDHPALWTGAQVAFIREEERLAVTVTATPGFRGAVGRTSGKQGGAE